MIKEWQCVAVKDALCRYILKPMQKNKQQATIMHDDIALLEQALTSMVKNLDVLARKRHYPLERAHYLLLGILQQQGNMNVGDLAQQLSLDKSTITRQLAAMERKALIVRSKSPSDGRSVLIQATPKGTKLVTDMQKLRVARMQQMLDGSTNQDLQAMYMVVKQLNQKIMAQIDADN